MIIPVSFWIEMMALWIPKIHWFTMIHVTLNYTKFTSPKWAHCFNSLDIFNRCPWIVFPVCSFDQKTHRMQVPLTWQWTSIVNYDPKRKRVHHHQLYPHRKIIKNDLDNWQSITNLNWDYCGMIFLIDHHYSEVAVRSLQFIHTKSHINIYIYKSYKSH